MFPLFSIIIALTIAMSYPEVVTEPVPPDILSSIAVVALVGVIARLMANRAVRRVLSDPGGNPEPIFRVASLLRPGIVIAYGAIVYQLHWPAIVRSLGIEYWILVDEFVVLLPFLAMLVLTIHAEGRAERRLNLHDFSPGAYLSFQLRQFLLPVAPVAMFLLLHDLVTLGDRAGVGWVSEMVILLSVFPFLRWISLAVLLFLLYCLMPFLLKWSFKAKSLPAGSLRDRLEAFSKREGFKARDILLWPTGGNVLNAAVIGVSGPFRFVLMTDALVDELPEDEVEAVFAHEVGHARHNHMLLFFFFTLAYGLLAYLILENLPPAVMNVFENPNIAHLIIGTVGFLLWFFIIFGFISRRFEQQADVFGALSTGRSHGETDVPAEEHPFVRALSGLRRQMGEVRETKGWRPLSERISYLIEFLSDEKVRRSYRRRMRTLLVFFIGLLVTLWAAAAATIPSQLSKGEIQRAAVQAARAQSRGERLRATFASRRYLELTAKSKRAEYRLRAMEQLQVLTSGLPAPRDRIDRWTELSSLYLPLLGPTASRKALTEALVITEDLRRQATLLAVSDPTTGWSFAGEMAERTQVLLALLGDSLAREGHIKGARLAYQDALRELPSDHVDRVVIRERIEGLEPGS